MQSLVSFKKSSIVVHAAHIGRIVVDLGEDITQASGILKNSVVGAFGVIRLSEGVNYGPRERLLLSTAAVGSKREKLARSTRAKSLFM